MAVRQESANSPTARDRLVVADFSRAWVAIDDLATRRAASYQIAIGSVRPSEVIFYETIRHSSTGADTAQRGKRCKNAKQDFFMSHSFCDQGVLFTREQYFVRGG